jgi:hypothetical protein
MSRQLINSSTEKQVMFELSVEVIIKLQQNVLNSCLQKSLPVFNDNKATTIDGIS